MSSPFGKLLAEWFWADRWMGSSAFLLPMEARGLYREMLTQAWRRGAALPNDHEQIRRATGCTKAEWKRAWPQIERFWRVDGTLLVNDTQLEVYAEAQRHATAASNRGRAGAAARWSSNAQVDAQVSLGQSPPVTVSVQEEPQERTAAPPPVTGKPSTWKRACAIAHKVIEANPKSLADQADDFKSRCAAQGLDYGELKDGRPLFARALDYVEGVRRRRTH